MIGSKVLWRWRRRVHFFLRRLSQRTNQLSKEFAAKAPIPSTMQVRQEQSFLVVTDWSGDSIAVPTFSRLSLYRAGVSRRLEALSREYCLDPSFFDSPRVVVDVGANSGEFGLMTARSGGEYFGFEPDPLVFPALAHNVPQGHLHQLAIGDHDGEAALYLATDLADSSLFGPETPSESVSVNVRRLDSLLDSGLIPRRIDLLKVEAEGFEEEVLRGARDTLDGVKWLAVDAGPERGGETTIVQVVNLLRDTRFQLEEVQMRRGCLLFSSIS